MAEPTERPHAAANALPPLIFTPEEVAARLGITPRTLKNACWAHKLPYRIKQRWIGPGRAAREMVFTMREIQIPARLLRAPVERLREISALRRPRSGPKPPARPRGPRSSAQPAPPRRQEESP